MKKYTIGIILDNHFKKVVLIKKQRPEWQKGKWNFPGGHIEQHEAAVQCVSREIKEETGLVVLTQAWNHIGTIINKHNYYVEVFTTFVYGEVSLKKTTDEKPSWHSINSLPKNLISNLPWLIQFAINFHKQGNADKLTFGIFDYKY